MTSTEDYRQYAAQCIGLAEKQSNAHDKARLLEMAQAFLRMAERKERAEADK